MGGAVFYKKKKALVVFEVCVRLCLPYMCRQESQPRAEAGPGLSSFIVIWRQCLQKNIPQ